MYQASRNIFCEGFFPDNIPFDKKNDLDLRFNDEDDSKNNVRIDLDYVTNAIINKDFLAFDLIRIATYIYIADCQIERDYKQSDFDKKWNFDLNFYIPVSNKDFWNRKDIKELLYKILNFSVGHNYSFTFGDWENKNKQLFLEMFDKEVLKLDIDCISLFSGGIDSLYSAISLLENKRKPFLISHKTTAKLINFRSNLVNGLNNDYNKDIKKSEITINNKNNPTKDHTLRSRSLLYGFLGIAFAKCLDLKDVYLSDNGIISLNLKSTAQNIDTLNTRSTNPKLIYLVNQLSKLLWNEKAPQIENLLLWKTKGEIIEELKTLKKSKLLAFTSSCVSTINLSISEPYCGICSQCIDRRFAVDWANISDNDDPRSHYKVNIFQDDLVGINDKGIAKTHAENFYRKARFIYQASDYEFLNFNNELYDYIPDNEDEEDFLRKAFDLHKRFSNQVLDVIGQFGTEYLKRDFPENSLISMAFRESSSKIDLNEYSLPKKKDLIINKRMHQVLYKGIEINLTPFEFKFLLRLASEPEACITYEELQTGEDSGKDSYSTPAHTHRTNINKKFKDTCKKWHIGLHNKFSITETISGKGYRLNSDLRESFEII